MATRKKRSKAKRAPKAKKTEMAKPNMAEQLKEARKRYTVSKSAKGTTSAHNGDDVATLLAGCSPEDVCSTAEKLAGMKPGELAAKYSHLNPGQVRKQTGGGVHLLTY